MTETFAHPALLHNKSEGLTAKTDFPKECYFGKPCMGGVQNELFTSEKGSFLYGCTTLAGSSPNQLSAVPTITIDSGMGSFNAEVGNSHTQYYYVDGFNFTGGQTVRVEVSDLSGSFTISNSSNSGFGTTIEIFANSDGGFSQMIYVKYAPTEVAIHSATLAHSGDGAETKTLMVDGSVISLPVEWVSLKAEIVKEAIVLNWITASEKNNSHFEVEMSKNPATGFEEIGSIDSKMGNSKLPTRYMFEYYFGAEVGIYYFRLKQVDFDQVFSYSKVIAIEIFATSGTKLKVVAPNPTTAFSQVSITVAEAGKLNIVILNMSGTEIFSKSFKLQGGENNVKVFSDAMMPAGVYILAAQFNGKFDRLKLIKE